MTQEQFDNTNWHVDMKAVYKGRKYEVASVDFGEGLVGLDFPNDDELMWVRFENCELEIYPS